MRDREKKINIVGVVAWLIVFALAGFMLCSEVRAAPPGAICTERKGVADKLGQTYSEARVNMGLASNGSVIEVFSTEDGGTFTLMITNPDGITCMMAAGRNWESFKFKLEDQVRHGDSL